MNGTARSTIKVGLGNNVMAILWVGFIAAIALLSLALALTPGLKPVVRLTCLVAAALSAFWTRSTFRRLFPAEGRLRIDVGNDAIELLSPGRGSEVFRKTDLELVQLDEGGFNGVGSFSLYGPDDMLLGIWETNWVLLPPQLVMRVLKRHGYPYALKSTLYGRRFYQRAGRTIDDTQ